ncbi:MAG: hypothetical protein M1827_005440 [Pycnora praestabilis]|nr:MAG: hypothetical protein M1827_005440 [Pycnora praestabilis]
MANSTSGYFPRFRTAPLLNTSRSTAPAGFSSNLSALSSSIQASLSSASAASVASVASVSSVEAQSTSAQQTSSSPQPSSTSQAPSTTAAPQPSTSVAVVTSVTVESSSSGGDQQGSTVVVVLTTTNTPAAAPTSDATTSSSSHSSSSTVAALPASTSSSSSKSSGGLSTGGKTAVAVVVPVVAVALIVLACLFLWRRRKQRKAAEEQRRMEVEDYNFNPNNDPTLPAVGATSSNPDDENYSEMRENDAGYRGWGNTSNNRKASTTLSSGNGIGMALSDKDSNPDRYNGTGGSPIHDTAPGSEAHSGEPLVNSPHDRPTSGDSETIGALGAGPNTMGNKPQDINRGPSNASSSYSAANRSDGSGEGPIPGSAHGQQYYNDGTFYEDGNYSASGPYGDGTYGAGQPVIRDVQARRNTRIEKPTVFPQQGNSGISQNF